MNSTDADNSLQNPVNTMEQTLLAYCRRQGLFPVGGPCHRCLLRRGGFDGAALFSAALQSGTWHHRHGGPCGPRNPGRSCHADARFVAEFCRTHHVPFFLYDAAASGVQIPPNPSENWARSLRYTWFDALAAQQHACIATAHTLSDQAETVLFRMARGTGLHGMAGIPGWYGACTARPIFVPDKERYTGILRRPWATLCSGRKQFQRCLCPQPYPPLCCSGAANHQSGGRAGRGAAVQPAAGAEHLAGKPGRKTAGAGCLRGRVQHPDSCRGGCPGAGCCPAHAGSPRA